MRLVLAALSRPVSALVAVVAIALCAFLAVRGMPVDIFPNLGAPAIYVAQPYGGMDPQQMEGFLTYYFLPLQKVQVKWKGLRCSRMAAERQA
jgi:multidrug efflux pump subunit AcrB